LSLALRIGRLWPAMTLVTISHIAIIYAYQFAFIRENMPADLSDLLGLLSTQSPNLWGASFSLNRGLLGGGCGAGLYYWKQFTDLSNVATSLWQAVVGFIALLLLFLLVPLLPPRFNLCFTWKAHFPSMVADLPLFSRTKLAQGSQETRVDRRIIIDFLGPLL